MILRSILGPALGGALAQPCENLPAFFARGTIFDQCPFLLPNLVCAVILGFGVLIGTLFLEETHEEKKYRRDLGLQAGRWLLDQLKYKPYTAMGDKAGDAIIEEYCSLLEDEAPPGYRTNEGSPWVPSSPSQTPCVKGANRTAIYGRKPHQLRGVKKAFTKPVVLNIIGFGILA